MTQWIFNYVIDLVYVALAVITLIVFYKRGFIDSVFRFGRVIFAGILAYLIGPSVGEWLKTKYIYGWINDWVSEKVSSFLNNTAGAVDIGGLIDQLPFLVRQLVNKEELVEKYSGEALENVASDFAQSAAQPLASLLSNLIAYIAVYFLALLVLFLVFKALDLLSKLPVLNAINKILGLIFGAIAAFLLLALVTYILGIFVGIIGSANQLTELVASSRLFRFFNGISLFNLF